METITNMGILTNTSNIYDATDYRTDEAELLYDDKYQGGTAITCSKPGTKIFDTGIIDADTFAGTYSIGFYYDSTTATVQGTPLMRFEIYEDGVLMHEDITIFSDSTVYEYDLNFIKYAYLYGLHDTKVLKASSTYQIIIKTSDNLVNDAILDYVTLSRIGDNCLINGKPQAQGVGARNRGFSNDLSTEGTQFISEVIGGGLTGTIAAAGVTTGPYTYSTPFKLIAGAWVNIKDGNGKIFGNCIDKNYTNQTITAVFRNVSNSAWSSSDTDNIRIFITGYI